MAVLGEKLQPTSHGFLAYHALAFASDQRTEASAARRVQTLCKKMRARTVKFFYKLVN
jgi:hypothetical protein